MTSWLERRSMALRATLAIACFALPQPASGADRVEYPLECTYAERGTGLESQGPCARLEDDVPRIDPGHVARMTFRKGLAEVRIDGVGIAYVRRSGRAVRIFIFDNGADYFVEGLARGLRHGKLVYYDRRLRPVIVTEYDWGSPFKDGRADVCVGCVAERRDGEHEVMVGGRWGVIDRQGRPVEPLAPQLGRSDPAR